MKLFGAMEIESNELCIGGISCSDLVKQLGSTLYVMDENLLIFVQEVIMIILSVKRIIIELHMQGRLF